MKKNKDKKYYLILLICVILILSILIYFIINLVGSNKLNNKNNIGNNISLKEEDIYYDGDVKIFKGENPNNYLYFSNILWRIISINKDGSLDVTTDNSINILKNINYDVNKYVNDIFLSGIDKKYLDRVSYCNDIISKIEKVECKNIYTRDYARLLSIEDIINSNDNGNSYLLNNLDYWLNNRYDSKPFVINSNKITNDNNDKAYGVRPVIRLNSSTIIKSGNGTIDNPYIVSEDNTGMKVGSYIKLDNDLWIVYEVNKNRVNLALVNCLSGVKLFGDNSEFNVDKEGSIAYYLNNDYLDSLSYKDMLISSDWKTGKYIDSYDNVDKNIVSTKVGMLSVKDLKLVNNKWGYYLITPSDEKDVYIYNTDNFISKTNYLHNIVPTISIKNNYKLNGLGTKDNPFEVEV